MNLEEVPLLGDHPRSVALETRRNRKIDNVIAPESGPRGDLAYARIVSKYGQLWINRKPACGMYNCFGLVFASRRTAIYNEKSEVAHILKDDEYRPVARRSDLRVGDVVLYRVGDDYVHSARVTKVETANELTSVYALRPRSTITWSRSAVRS
jgi:hypothetical protein